MDEPVEGLVELVLTPNGNGAAKLNQVDGFLEAFVFWSEYHGTAKGDWLLDVVDVDAEPTADIDKTGILVELGEDSDGVDHMNLAGTYRSESFMNLPEVFFRDVMRRNDHAVILGKPFDIRDEQLFIWWP